MEIKVGQILENVLPGAKNKTVVVRVIEFVDSVQMWRVTDDLETRDDRWLIEHNRTWAAPIENLRPHYSESCEVCHKNGLVFIGGQ